jgi:hypothetical protein
VRLIDYNGSIEVHSSLLNVVLHDQPQIKTWLPPTAAALRGGRERIIVPLDKAILAVSTTGAADDKPDPAAARAGRAKAIIAPSRWYKKSVRP